MSIFPHLAVLGLAAALSSPIHQHQIDFKTTSPEGIQRINQLWLVTYNNEAGLETVAQAKLDDRFHETGIDGTGSMLVDSSFETERGVCHGKMASGGRVGDE